MAVVGDIAISLERDAVLLLGQWLAALGPVATGVLPDDLAALVFALACSDVLNLQRHDLLLIGTFFDHVVVLFLLIRARDDLALGSVESLRVHLHLGAFVHVAEVPVDRLSWNFSIIIVVLGGAEGLALYFIHVESVALQAAVGEE